MNELLDKGVSVNVKQPGSGSTPLNTAAVFGQTAVGNLLIDKGADVSMANADGNTALHIASFFAHEKFVQLLLDKGASVTSKSRRGETPLDVVSADWTPQLEGFYQSAQASVPFRVLPTFPSLPADCLYIRRFC